MILFVILEDIIDDNLIDKMIEYFIEKNTDTLIAGGAKSIME